MADWKESIFIRESIAYHAKLLVSCTNKSNDNSLYHELKNAISELQEIVKHIDENGGFKNDDI